MRGPGAVHMLGLGALLLLCACGGTPGASPDPVVAPPGGCSDLARPLFDYYHPDSPTCGPERPPLREIVPVGGGAFLLWVPASGYAQLWKPSAAGYSPVSWLERWWDLTVSMIATWAYDDLVLSLHEKNGDLALWKADRDAPVGAALLERQSTGPFAPTVLMRELLALDREHVLVWFPGDGSFAVHRLDRQAPPNVAPLDAVPISSGTHPRFLRGHELVALDPTRLLEWEPRTGDYRIWGSSPERGAADPFSAAPLAQGNLPALVRDLPGGRDVSLLMLERGQLLIWNRALGELSVIDFDASVRDPLAEVAPRPLGVSPGLRSLPRGYEPPVRSNVPRLVILVQRGRSFDFYLGRACQAPTGAAASCTEGGLACCDAMPDATPGAVACFPFDPSRDDYVVDETPACLADKIDHGAMDRFVASAIPGCGDPHAFACLPPEGNGYAALVARGALADRFFQSTAANSGQMSLSESNFMYLAFGAHRVGGTAEQSGQSINGLFAAQGIPWAVYLPDPVGGLLGQKAPLYYDAHWGHFRFFDELERDIAEGQLGPVSVVLAPPALGEEPGGGPPAAGVAYVEKILDDVQASAYRDETLVLVTHLTAGGFFDHVSPPPDDGEEIPPQPYGPRVPLLAFGRGVRPGHVSHAPLELSSLTAFLEWNWLPQGTSLAGRDRRVNDLGSLLDPSAGRDGDPVPPGPNAQGQ